MARVLAPGGQLMIYVWALEQENRRFERQDVLVPWNRALCSQAFPECSQSGRTRHCGHAERSHPYPPPYSECGYSACFKERCGSKQPPSTGHHLSRTCCVQISKEGEEENGFYTTLGRSFRAWFFSRSLDESFLSKQVDRARPSTNPGWASNTVAVQPSRHCSLDLGHGQPRSAQGQDLDEEVFEASASQTNVPRLRAPGAQKHLNGDHRGRTGGNGDGPVVSGPGGPESAVGAGNLEGGHPAAGTRLRRNSTAGSTASVPDGTIPVAQRQRDALDPSSFMRYYHVFRDGELCGLLTEHVAELRILSAGNDHGNWCLIAEKRGGD
ncbi:putative tRNA methyltransferase 9B isoform X1 [Tenrec ecaudatus]